MMQEMYDWYMDNLYPEHRKRAIKHAEKDGRDRKKRLAQGPIQGSSPTGMNMLEMKMLQIQSGTFRYNPDKSRSKWERIGSPMVASWIDWAIIINPFDVAPGTGWEKRRAISAARQWDRFQEYSN